MEAILHDADKRTHAGGFTSRLGHQFSLALCMHSVSVHVHAESGVRDVLQPHRCAHPVHFLLVHFFLYEWLGSDVFVDRCDGPNGH